MLSHITVAEVPNRDKLLIYSDVAVIPEPTLAQREAMMGYLVKLSHTLGIKTPRVALIHFTEKVNPKFPVSTDYVALKEMAAQGRWGDVIVDGPMDIPTALEPEAGQIKGIISPIEGQADCLMMPDIQAANVFYKTISHFGGATNAGMLVGTMARWYCPREATPPRASWPAWPWLAWPQCTDLNTHLPQVLSPARLFSSLITSFLSLLSCLRPTP